MKTLYCLGGVPQFKIPCLKYSFLLKEKENSRNLIGKNHSIDIKDFYNIKKEKNKMETLADKYIDEIFPSRGIKRCLQINPNMKIRMKKYFKDLKGYLSLEKNKVYGINEQYKKNINNYQNKKSQYLNNSNDNRLHNMKLIFGSNPQNNLTLFNRNDYNNESILSLYKKEKMISTDFPGKNKHSRNLLELSKIDLSPKLYNYNYNFQISKDSSSVDLFQSLYKSLMENNGKNRDKHFITISNDNTLKNDFKKQIIYNNQFLRYLHNKKNNIEENSIKNINNNNTNSNKLNKTNYKISHIQLESTNINNTKIDKSNSIEKIKLEIKKRKRKSGRSKKNKLNILYSETEDQFYVKYEKYRKRKFLKGLCLTNIDASPKIKFNKLDKKIDLIKNKVDVLKSIADKTFPKVLANITSIKNEFDNNIRKRKYDKPYIEKLNKIIKEQNNMNSYLSKPIEIRSHKHISENNKLNE